MKASGRYPIYGIAATIIVTLISTVFLFVYNNARVSDATRNATALQEARLNEEALQSQEVLGMMGQLARVQIAITGPLQRRTEVIQSVHRLFTTTNRRLIFGIAIAYAPYMFDRRRQNFGVYEFADGKSRDALEVIDGANSPKYETEPWFTRARRANGHLVFVAPYTGRRGAYVIALQAFYFHKHFAGAVFVDARVSLLQAALRKPLLATDRVEVLNAAGERLWSAGDNTGPRAGESSIAVPLRLVPWTIRLTSSLREVERARDALITSTLLALILWSVAALIIRELLKSRLAQLNALTLQAESSDLQREILSRVAAEEQLRVVAYQDPLTGLPNRLKFLDMVSDHIDLARRERHHVFGVFLIDLDQFAVINDSLGHGAGDVILTMVAQRIAETLPHGAMLGRLGGDEFVICMSLENAAFSATEFASRVVEAIRRPLVFQEREISITGSVGIVIDSGRYESSDAMLRDADVAMYAAKNAGRARFAIFDASMHERAVTRLSLDGKIRRAIRHHDIVAHYQPIIELATGRIHAVEALARWQSSDATGIATADFILAAEQSGLIGAIDSEILQQACDDAHRLEEVTRGGIIFSVNVSAMLFQQEDAIARLSAIMESSGLHPSRLKIELTETAIMERADESIRLLERLRSIGPQVVIDDFGTGYSSLSYVQKLPISGLKIDRSFITPIAPGNRSAAIVQAIVALARALGLHITAEGVETREQLTLLEEIGVDYVQGWYFSKALPYDELVQYVKQYGGTPGRIPSLPGVL